MTRLLLLICLAAALQVGGCGPLIPAHAAIPSLASKYQRLLVRSAQANWGLDAPVAALAAQVHQESRWNTNAKSPVGAQGLAQFMPSTADWISELYPLQLGYGQAQDPDWALQALVMYDRWLYQRIQARDSCEQMAMTLSAYNGGLGWVYKDQNQTAANGFNRSVWFDLVEKFTARASWAKNENRQYVRVILLRWQPLYLDANWGLGICQHKLGGA